MLTTEQMPKTIMEYLEQYSWVDSEHIISNGIEYVPLFRVKRALEYYCPTRLIAQWENHPTEREWDVCSNCHTGVKRREYGWLKGDKEWVNEESYQYCPWCGAKIVNE